MNNHNQQEIEATVLGCLLAGGDFFQIQSLIGVNDFIDTKHQHVYAAIETAAMNDEPYDAVSLLDKNIDISATQKLFEYGAATANLPHYAKRLAQVSMCNQIKRLLLTTQHNLNEGNTMPEVNKLQIDLEKITHAQLQDAKPWPAVIRDGLVTLEQRSQTQDSVIITGLPDADDKFMAIHGARLVILAARPSVGKTALVQQMALRSAQAGKSVGIISLEMNYDELAIRAIANRLN